jgi:DNA-binding NtrC family response regulator
MSRRATVLHVDDDPALLRLVEEIFAEEVGSLGYVSAASGAEALEELDEIRGPLVLLVDLGLAGTELRSFVDEVAARRDEVSVPTFVLSGSEDPNAVAEAYAQGAAAYLEKPIDADGFYEIANLLERYTRIATFPSSK